jgi:hypothetical protein
MVGPLRVPYKMQHLRFISAHLLEPKGSVLECGSAMNIACCNDGDGQSNVFSKTDSSASANMC